MPALEGHAINDARGESWQWIWSMDRGPPDFRVQGSTNSKPEAQAELEQIWRAWVETAERSISYKR